MNDDRIALALEVLHRGTSGIDAVALEGELYRALEEDLPLDVRRAIVDVLALLSQARSVASGKGTKRDKGEKILRLLNLTNAKPRHVEYRDRMLCKVIASEMRSQNSQRLTSVLRDNMANLIATDPAEISRIWRAGRTSALAEVTRPLEKKMVRDEKIVLAELSNRLGKARGN